MKKYVLMLLVFVFISGCCTDDTPDPTWNPPQPMDERLLGSWQSGDVIVTFSENNECFIEFKDEPSTLFGGPSLNWYISGDVLVLPPYFDSRTKRFAEYRYKLEGYDLHLEWINHPFVGCGDFTLEGPHSPLLIDKEVFTELEK